MDVNPDCFHYCYNYGQLLLIFLLVCESEKTLSSVCSLLPVVAVAFVTRLYIKK